MSSKKYIATLIAISGFLTAFADTDNLTGAWKGPKDLMVNLCIDNDKQLYVGYCGILRTYGWVDFSTSLTPDSLIIKSADIGSPFEGRFKIESDNRLVGKLEMGSHGDDWYSLKRQPVASVNRDMSIRTVRSRLSFSEAGALTMTLRPDTAVQTQLSARSIRSAHAKPS